MDTNGTRARAHLTARVADLEAALTILARRLADQWAPRFLGHERELELLADTLRELAEATTTNSERLQALELARLEAGYRGGDR